MGDRKTAALYVRTSTDEQSGRGQIEALRRAASARGLAGARLVHDQGCSGKTAANPPGLAGLLRDAQAGRLQVLLVAALDRLGRSLGRVVHTLAALDAAGCRVVSLRESLDLSTAGGRLQAQLVCAFAEFEGALISERTRADLAAARKRGVKLGRPKVRLTAEQEATVRAAWGELSEREVCALVRLPTEAGGHREISRGTLRRVVARMGLAPPAGSKTGASRRVSAKPTRGGRAAGS